MSVKDLEKNLKISVEEAIERDVEMNSIIGALEYIKCALIRSMQDTIRKEKEERND